MQNKHFGVDLHLPCTCVLESLFEGTRVSCLPLLLPQVAFYVYPQHMGAVQQGAAANSSAGPVAVRLTDFTPSVMHIRQLNSSSIGEVRAAGMHNMHCIYMYVGAS